MVILGLFSSSSHILKEKNMACVVFSGRPGGYFQTVLLARLMESSKAKVKDILINK